MPIDLSNQQKKVSVNSDEIVIAPNQQGKGFGVLQDGELSYAIYPFGTENDKKIIVDTITGPCFFGELSIYGNSIFTPHCLTTAPSTISTYPIDNIGYLFKEKPTVGLHLLSSMTEKLKRYSTKCIKYYNIKKELDHILNSLTLILSHHNYLFSNDDINKKKNQLSGRIQSNQQNIKYDESIFDLDLSSLNDDLTKGILISNNDLRLIEEIAKTDTSIISSLYKNNLNIPISTFNWLAKHNINTYKLMSETIISIFTTIQTQLLDRGGILGDLEVFLSTNNKKISSDFKSKLISALIEKIASFTESNQSFLKNIIEIQPLTDRLTSLTSIEPTTEITDDIDLKLNEDEREINDSADIPSDSPQESTSDSPPPEEDLDDFFDSLDSNDKSAEDNDTQSINNQEENPDITKDNIDESSNSDDGDDISLSEENEQDKEYIPTNEAPQMWDEIHTQDLEYPPAEINYDKKTFKNYYDQICDYAGTDEELYKNLKKNLASLGTSHDTVSITDNNRKITRQINTDFLHLYYDTIVKNLKTETTPEHLKYFLEYGLLTEDYIDDDLAQFIYEIEDGYQPDLPVINLSEWLKLIYEGKEIPSINEFGIDYNKFIRERDRRLSAKEKAALNNLSTEEKSCNMIKYEMDNMLKVVSAMMAPNRTSRFYPLTTKLCGNPKSSFMLKEKIVNLVNELRSYDFSLFYRETIFRYAKTSEIVQKEVEPYFIILPFCGDKVIFWQEISGNKKSTRARFFIPMFLNGSLRTSMIKAMANYRWELNRTIKGALYQNPVDGGVTGAFFDFILYFKKNNKLSFEAKEKLANVIRNNRKDPKKIFFLFYHQWIEYERRGIMKLDRYSRDLFFKFCPFSEHIRKFLERIPAYSGPINRYNNIQNREVTKMEARYKKKRNDAGELLPELQENLDFIKK